MLGGVLSDFVSFPITSAILGCTILAEVYTYPCPQSLFFHHTGSHGHGVFYMGKDLVAHNYYAIPMQTTSDILAHDYGHMSQLSQQFLVEG